MNISVKGQPNQIAELRELISNFPIVPYKLADIQSYDVIFDLDFDDNPEELPNYYEIKDCLIVAGSVKMQLEEILAEVGGLPDCTIIGMNTLPTLINRSLVECCAMHSDDEQKAKTIFDKLGLNSRFVASRVGLVTPRIVCMIINEAFYTVQEGTATKTDIDLGMKLGTAYPKGPFEWCSEIGIEHVYETLEALYEDTKDERYKICSLLKTEYLRSFSM